MFTIIPVCIKVGKDNKNVDALSGYLMDSKSDDKMLLNEIQVV